MTLPDWTFDAVMTQVVNFLNQDVIKGLVVTSLALGFIPLILRTVNRIYGR